MICPIRWEGSEWEPTRRNSRESWMQTTIRRIIYSFHSMKSRETAESSGYEISEPLDGIDWVPPLRVLHAVLFLSANGRTDRKRDTLRSGLCTPCAAIHSFTWYHPWSLCALFLWCVESHTWPVCCCGEQDRAPVWIWHAPFFGPWRLLQRRSWSVWG